MNNGITKATVMYENLMRQFYCSLSVFDYTLNTSQFKSYCVQVFITPIKIQRFLSQHSAFRKFDLYQILSQILKVTGIQLK